MKIAAVYRAERYSPNSEEKDRLMMDAVVSMLRGRGDTVCCMCEDKCSIAEDSDFCITMSRSAYADGIIRNSGIKALNPAGCAERCGKRNVREMMKTNSIPMPPDRGECGYWIKRGDLQPQGCDDVVFVPDLQKVADVKKHFAARGVENVVVEAHVKGDLIKFYAVEGTGFFRTFYPTDDGKTKFGNEIKNGVAHHYVFDEDKLKETVMSVSRLLDTPICGGDCIVREDGSFVIIDFNDWPSFSRCRSEAADAIVRLIDIKCIDI